MSGLEVPGLEVSGFLDKVVAFIIKLFNVLPSPGFTCAILIINNELSSISFDSILPKSS